MQRTFNYTSRKKIERIEAIFSLSEEVVPEFDVDLRLADIEQYPDDASLYVEAHYKETRQRFSFGKISKITPPSDRKLTEIDLSGTVQFDLLIVDETSKRGLLLARGERFTAGDDSKEDSKRSGIFDVLTRPLDQLAWKIDIENGQKPQLILNNHIPDAMSRIRSDAIFQSLILPSALKQVLTYYLWNEEDEEGDENFQIWLQLGEFYGEEKPESSDPAELLLWIDKVVGNFAKQFDLSDRLVNHLIGGNT